MSAWLFSLFRGSATALCPLVMVGITLSGARERQEIEVRAHRSEAQSLHPLSAACGDRAAPGRPFSGFCTKVNALLSARVAVLLVCSKTQ